MFGLDLGDIAARIPGAIVQDGVVRVAVANAVLELEADGTLWLRSEGEHGQRSSCGSMLRSLASWSAAQILQETIWELEDHEPPARPDGQ